MSETGDSVEIFGDGQFDLYGQRAREAAKKVEWDSLTSDDYLKYIAGCVADSLRDGAPAEDEITAVTEWRQEMERHLAERGTKGGRSSMVISHMISQQRAEQHGKA